MKSRQTNIQRLQFTWLQLTHLGLSPGLDPYRYNQGIAFNYMNLTGFGLALIRIMYLLIISPFEYSSFIWFLNFLPVICCATMIALMYRRMFRSTVYFSFFAFPSLIFLLGTLAHDRGMLFYLVPYLIYPFYFLNRRSKITGAFSFNSLLIIAGFIMESNLPASNDSHDVVLEIISFIGAFILVFVSLLYIKNRVWDFQKQVIAQKMLLEQKNREIAEQTQNLQDSNRIKDKVFSIIGHDLRSPIMGLQAIFENEDAAEAEEIMREVWPELKSELKKTAELFDNLLNWARLQIREAEVVRERIDLCEISHRVMDFLSRKAQQKGVLLSNEISSTEINADRNIIEIVLRNLVSNAIKFSQKGGVITMKTSTEPHFHLIQVSDQGVGMDDFTISQIKRQNFFTRHGTSNEKGTGLGLIICQDLIRKCNGEINIESRAGRGTTISIQLPVES